MLQVPAVNPTTQADTPRLTLVASTARPERGHIEVIDPLRFLQSITASLDVDQVLRTLTDVLEDLVGQSSWEYRHLEQALEFSAGTPDRHRLEYVLTLNEQEMGTLVLTRGRRFSVADQEQIEELLGLAAPALRNALSFLSMSQQLESDPLTGLGNRRALTLQGAQRLADSIRHGYPLSMLVMDLDSFKSVNDTHGHMVGDRLLCAVAAAIRSATRAGDLCARIGGDEFVVLLPRTGIAAALECGERIRRAIAKVAVQSGGDLPVTTSVSVGVAAYRGGMDLDQLYRQADDALYAAKRSGANRVLAGACQAATGWSDAVGICS